MSAESILFDAPGPRARLRHRLFTVVGLALVLAGAWVVYGKLKSANQLEAYLWEPFVTDPSVWLDYLLPGLWETLKAAAASVVLAGVFGIVFGMGRLAPARPVRWVSGVVVEFFRSVPVLLMMVFFFYGWFATASWLPNRYAPMAAVVLALTLYNGSVIAELVRSGVHSLPAGQAEAGRSIGLTDGQTLRLVQLPQALRSMLPALVGQLVVVLKDTALGTVVLYPELLTAARTLGSAYANTVQAYVVAALMFIALNYALSSAAGWVERRMRRRQRSAGGAVAATPLPGAAEA